MQGGIPRIGTVFSPGDGHTVVGNMYRKAINILRKMCIKLILFTRLTIENF
jgi:hypothetical protein